MTNYSACVELLFRKDGDSYGDRIRQAGDDRVDHPRYYLISTVEGIDIIDEVGRDEIKILYDIYHSFVMDEDTPTVLAGRVDRIAHVHLADHPGRNEPGTGRMDWQARVDWPAVNGYDGVIGLEYKPTGEPSQAFPSRSSE